MARLPDGPGETLLSLEQVQSFLEKDFDEGRFMKFATLGEDGMTRQVTLKQLKEAVEALSAGGAQDDDNSPSGEEKGGEGRGVEDKGGNGEKEDEKDDGQQAEVDAKSDRGSRPQSSAAGSRPQSSAAGSRPQSRPSGSEGGDGQPLSEADAKKIRRATRRAREREEKLEVPEPPLLTMMGKKYLQEATELTERLRKMRRVRYWRTLKEANEKKAQEDAEERERLAEEEAEKNKEEAAANEYVARLSAIRKRLGWGNWDQVKKELEEGEGDDDDMPPEEDAPEEKEEDPEAKAAREAMLLQEAEDLKDLQEKLDLARAKLDVELKGEVYRPSPESEARFFLREHYAVLALPAATRFREQIATSYDPAATLSLDPGREEEDIHGRDECVSTLLRAFGSCRLSFSVQKLEVARKPKRGCDLSFSAIVHVQLDDDAPRAVMEIFDLKVCSEPDAPLGDLLVVAHQAVVVRDNRPLYTFAIKPPPKTRHDNLEPHIRALFPPTAAEMEELAVLFLERDRGDMVRMDAESKVFEEYREAMIAKAAAEAAEAAEKARLAALFAEEEDDDEGEEEEEEEEEEDEKNDDKDNDKDDDDD